MSWLETSFSTWNAGGVLLIPLAIISLFIFIFVFRSAEAVGKVMKDLNPLCHTLESTSFTPERLLFFLKTEGNVMGQLYYKPVYRMMNGDEGMSVLEELELQCVRAHRKDELLLSAFTASAPLLGLLGTVIGMIDTFDAVALLSGNTGEQVADGISRALITTQFGLVIALPGVFGIAHLHKQVRNLETRLAQCRFLILEMIQGSNQEME